MKQLPISQIMSHQVHHVQLEDEVVKARDLMDKYEINHLPVLDEGKMVGILSANDLKKVGYLCDFIGEKLEQSTIFKSLSISELMTENVRSIAIDASTLEAIQLFSTESFQCLPVLDGENLAGIVTTKDLFATMLVD